MSAPAMTELRTADEIEAEARRLVAAAAGAGVAMRLIGGLAVRVHCPGHPFSGERDYRDVDFVTASRLLDVARVFEDRSYEPFTRFNALHGHSRAIFYGPGDGLKADVFLGRFTMCHELPLFERLDVDPLTVPLAELLLTKLQIVRMNAKDVLDVGALLAEHPVGDGDAETIHGDRIALICSRDWGLYHTVDLSLQRLLAELGRLPERDAPTVRERVCELQRRIEAHEKTRRWRLRARVGERVQWYEDPDEVVDAR
jgi:hypothetical protein